MEPRVFEKYLRRSGTKHRFGAGFFRAVVIPACDEAAELPRTLDSLDRARAAAKFPVAVITVVNHPAGASDKSSLETLDLLSKRADPELFVLYAPGISGGVGEARKLGMDAFVAAHTAESVDDTLIWSLDADTRVVEDYFTRVEAAFADRPRAGFCTVGFRHEPGATPELERAIREYEAYLRGYAASLRRAGSPYAFTALGSAIVCRGAACIRAGGMKRRAAGEDFYFLQELVKCGGVAEIPEVLVHPSPRLSSRVPFGTGPAMRKMLAGEAPESSSPEAFAVLAALLSAAAAPGALDSAAELMRRIPREAREFLEAEGFGEVWRRILANQPRNDDARLAAWHRWFDGLKTLRLLHRCDRRDR